MARSFADDQKAYYRVVVIAKKNGRTKNFTIGPYQKMGIAAGELTKHKKNSDDCIGLRDGWKFSDGWIEEALLIWKRL